MGDCWDDRSKKKKKKITHLYCELFYIQVLTMVIITETLTSTSHHDIFTYLDYIFSCYRHTVGFYPYLLSWLTYISHTVFYISSCCHISINVWLQHSECPKKKKIDENYTMMLYVVLTAVPYKTAAERPLSSHLINHQMRWARHAVYCWRRKDKLISSIILWTSRNGHTSVG